MSSLAMERAIIFLEKRDGSIKPSAVVDYARPEDSDIHGEFEWNDSVAAEHYRENQARGYIRRFSYVSETVITSERRTIIYVRDPSLPPKEQGYISTSRARTHHDLAMGVIRDELRRCRGAIERGLAVADVVGLNQDFETLLAEILGIEGRL